MKKVNLLSRTEMRKVMGGTEAIGGIGQDGDPGDPSGDGGGGDGGGGGGYKCCWTGTSVCSRCVAEAKSNWICVSGATLTAC